MSIAPMALPLRPRIPCVRCNGTRFVRALPQMAVSGMADNDPKGVLELYVCRSCGHVEWYCRTPGDIPIGASHGTEEFDVSGEGPYR